MRFITPTTLSRLQVMRSLLMNVHGRLTNGPVLVICYTNHALDQFLTGIASFSDAGIVRIGSRSKAEELARFNLKAVIQSEREANKRAGVGGEKARLRRSLIARQAELQVRKCFGRCVMQLHGPVALTTEY